MPSHKSPYCVLAIVCWCLMPHLTLAQGSFFKFPVTHEGVYKITEAQARQMGAGSLDEITILGHQGPLPQKLEPEALELKQVGVKKIGNELFFYLSGPHFHPFVNGRFDYQHHPYTDTLHYLVQTRSSSQLSIHPLSSGQAVNQADGGDLYTLQTKKEEEYNVLNSGRKWYGNRTFNGQRVNVFFPSVKSQSQIYYAYQVMAGSQAASQYNFQLNDHEVTTTTVPSIPEATYGVKGREVKSEGFFTLPINTGTKASFLYTTAHPNGTGYIDYLTIGYPLPIQALETGIYHRLGEVSGRLPLNGLSYFAIGTEGDNTAVTELSPGAALPSSVYKLAAFNPANVPSVAPPVAVNIGLRDHVPHSELIIITPRALRSQADKLAEHRNKNGISTAVVILDDIYNAYGYGNRDVTAIRNFVAHAYRSGGQLKNLLLFGKGTYDYKFQAGGRPNLIPVYSSRGSLNPLATYGSDDFYGFLEWGEGDWEEDQEGDHTLSIGVGRLPVINIQEAASVVEKLINYDNQGANLGEWKKKVLLFADDGDNNLHLNDSERHAALVHERHPEIHLEKLYLDAFPQSVSNNREQSPAAEAALMAHVRAGVLLINYVGHGNETTLTAERVFTTSQLANWPERSNLPVFVTATCEFGRHDSPFSRSGAEDMLTLRRKGAIALFTTGRPVFSSANFALNKAFMDQAFVKSDGAYLSLGELYKMSKNNSKNGVLNRSFSLLGDPSMKMALPELEVQAEALTEMEIDIVIDTLRAKQSLLISGKITDPLTQSTISGFEGEYIVTVTDKPKSEKTLGNESPATTFLNENTAVFRGKGKVENGQFISEVFIPSLIKDEVGRGLIRVFAVDPKGMEALGARAVPIGGQNPLAPADLEGPKIRMMVADTSGRVSKIASTSIPFFALLEDKSGINISAINPSQLLMLTVNDSRQIPINRHYTAVNGSYTHGYVQTEITGLKEGRNTLTLSAFDNMGNGSTASIEVEVEGSYRLQITEHKSYPNPATEYSRFSWMHNRPGEDLLMSLRIFNILGSEIFSVQRRFPNASAVLDDMEWIFLQSKTKYPAKGTYIYELVLQSEADGTSDRKSGKLLIQ